MLNKNEKNLLKEAVEYNRNLIDNADGGIDEVLEKLVTISYKDYTVWNPLKDVTGRFKVNPEKEYDEKQINNFIDNYKKRIN